jgi:hypothetical protein
MPSLAVRRAHQLDGEDTLQHYDPNGLVLVIIKERKREREMSKG